MIEIVFFFAFGNSAFAALIARSSGVPPSAAQALRTPSGAPCMKYLAMPAVMPIAAMPFIRSRRETLKFLRSRCIVQSRESSL